MTKFCPGCVTEKDTSAFNKALKRKDGCRSYCKDCERDQQRSLVFNLKNAVFDKLGHACTRCGFADKRALQIDHVNGGGNQEHREIKNNFSFLKKVLQDDSGAYQILCANCNWIKRMDRLEHPRYSHTEEAKRRMSEAARKRIVSERTRQKQREAHLGRPAWNKGLPSPQRGIPRPDELKARLSQIAKEIQAKRTPEERSAIARKREANKKIAA